MAEKVKDKIIRLERELTDAIRSELSLAEQVNDFYESLQALQSQFTEYAIDHKLARDEESALFFLRNYSLNKQVFNSKQIKLDFRRHNEKR
jgi:hypothetical protein